MNAKTSRYRGPTNAQVVGLVVIALLLSSGAAIAVMIWLERAA